MDLVKQFMNLVVAPTILLTFSLLLPPIYLYKLFLSSLASFFPEKMTHKVVLITGASSGIGEQMAYQYAKKGAFLVLVARRESSLNDVAGRCQELGSPDVLVAPADVSNQEDCRSFIDAAIGRFGRLDHLVTNAGISNICMFEEADDMHIQVHSNNGEILYIDPYLHQDINFWGCIYPTHIALPHLRKSKGRIIVNSSAAAWSPMPRMSFYNASKSALLHFYETLRIEIGSDVGITIATPGWIESEMTQGKFLSKEGNVVVDQDIRDVQIGMMPVVYAEDCAKAIVDSACRGERYVTVPSWFRVLYVLRVLAPEVQDWCYRMMYLPRRGAAPRDALSKKILEVTGAKKVLYPDSIQTHEVKAD